MISDSRSYVVYKIINCINNMIYIGCHMTFDINDSYMGSGTNIKNAYIIFGKENFTKEILFVFDNRDDMFLKERELVNRQFIARGDTYNIIMGGGYNNSIDTISVISDSGETMRVHKDCPEYLSGELVGVTKGKVPVKDKDGKFLQVDVNDSRYLSGELVGVSKGRVPVKDKDGNFLQVDVNDSRYLSGELVSILSTNIVVKDMVGNVLFVSLDDPRYLSRELVPFWTGRTHSEETKRKIGLKNSIHQIGKGNSQYGTCWIYNIELCENKKIKNIELEDYLSIGWLKGRKMKFN